MGGQKISEKNLRMSSISITPNSFLIGEIIYMRGGALPPYHLCYFTDSDGVGGDYIRRGGDSVGGDSGII